ncbi:MAG: hypothetical protein KJO13_06325 [Gammaproteobacteria bacterium]|nr:hypothetical protein [Gammaproteobacteria bacterium]
MPNPAGKQRDSKAETPAEASQQKRQRSRNGLVADEFDMDCWEPSLRDKLHKASGRKKP